MYKRLYTEQCVGIPVFEESMSDSEVLCQVVSVAMQMRKLNCNIV